MPFWRPDPLTSMMESEGKPSASSSMRIGSNASCRMNASTFFMMRGPPWWWAPAVGTSRDPRGQSA